LTVGIAAISQQGTGSYVILASDRMVTAWEDTEYEPNKPKLYRLRDDNKIVVLIAGDTAAQSVIGQAASIEISRRDVSEVREAAEIFAKHVGEYRKDAVEREVLAPFGLTFDTYISRPREMSDALTFSIRDELRNLDSGVEAVVAGVESGGWSHIYQIADSVF